MDYFLPLEIESFNHIPRCDAWIDRAMDHHAINLAASGSFWWAEPDAEPQRVRTPVLYWTFPGVQYRYGSRNGETWDQRWVAFGGRAATRMREAGLLPSETARPIQTVRDIDGVSRDFDVLLAHLASDTPSSNRTVVMLEGLLLHLHESTRTASQVTTQSVRMREIARTIEQEPQRAWDFEREAERVCVSYSHFRKLFRAEFGCAPHQYVLRARMRVAASLLRAGVLPVKQCAHRAGFEDMQYFTRLFARHYGDPPARYGRRYSL